MCGFNLPRLLPNFDRYHMSITKTTIPLVLAALFVGSTNTVESSVRGAFERELRQEFSIASTMILLSSVLIMTHVSHATKLQIEQALDDKNERAHYEDEKKRKKQVEEVERLRAEMEASAALALALDRWLRMFKKRFHSQLSHCFLPKVVMVRMKLLGHALRKRVLSEDKNEAREEEEEVADEEDTVVADANVSTEKENPRMSVGSVKSTKSSVEVEDRRSLNRTSLGDVSCNSSAERCRGVKD